MTRLSVNINKIATLRNARGGNIPNVVEAVINCQKFGAQGITIHPRPDERHIRKKDVYEIRPHIHTELNIEGYPSENFIQLVTEVGAHQATLVPDPPDAITSNAGWQTKANASFLKEVIERLQERHIRTSIFVGTDLDAIEGAAETGTHRIELYTEPYAHLYAKGKKAAVTPFVKAANYAKKLGMEVNAGHDLNLKNVAYLRKLIPFLSEVSIGHALVAEALYLGLEKTIQLYLERLK
jgi:pyridoxine 5-phosphate synthase